MEHAAEDHVMKSLPQPNLNPIQQPHQNARDTNNGQSKRKMVLDALAEANKAGAEGLNQKKHKNSTQTSVQEVMTTMIDLCEDKEDNSSQLIAADAAETDRKRIEKAIVAEEDRPMNV